MISQYVRSSTPGNGHRGQCIFRHSAHPRRCSASPAKSVNLFDKVSRESPTSPIGLPWRQQRILPSPSTSIRVSDRHGAFPVSQRPEYFTSGGREIRGGGEAVSCASIRSIKKTSS